jgi:putative transposase
MRMREAGWIVDTLGQAEHLLSQLPRGLGFPPSESTVEKYRPKGRKPSSPTWMVFLHNHGRDLVSCDFFIVPTATFKVLFVFIILAHERRRIVHFNITEHPTVQ